MSTNDLPTPRTETHAFLTPQGEVVPAWLSQQLERELGEARVNLFLNAESARKVHDALDQKANDLGMAQLNLKKGQQMIDNLYGDLKAALNERNQVRAIATTLAGALDRMEDDIAGLISESHGVAGLHHNGDVAPWADIDEGGQYERLSSRFFARSAKAQWDAYIAGNAPVPKGEIDGLRAVAEGLAEALEQIAHDPNDSQRRAEDALAAYEAWKGGEKNSPASGWRPITTAPKDQTIDVCYKNQRFANVNWSEVDQDFMFSSHGSYYQTCATHWMPLPTFPEVEQRQPTPQAEQENQEGEPYKVPPFTSGGQEPSLSYYWWSWHPRYPRWSKSCWGGETEEKAWESRSKPLASGMKYYHNKLIREGDGNFTEVYDDPCRVPEVWRKIALEPRNEGDAMPIEGWQPQPEQQQQEGGGSSGNHLPPVWHGDGDPESGDPVSVQDVTHSMERVFPQDVAYVKLTDVLPLLEELKISSDAVSRLDPPTSEALQRALNDFLAKQSPEVKL